jgi:hypothetical protein
MREIIIKELRSIKSVFVAVVMEVLSATYSVPASRSTNFRTQKIYSTIKTQI